MKHPIDTINELMAQYLGWISEQYSSGKLIWFDTDELSKYVIARELNFHRDWNQLMMIVKKISQDKQFQGLCSDHMFELLNDLRRNLYFGDIDAVYNNCSDLIHETETLNP